MQWHPMIVHFPIALFVVGFLLDAVGWLLKKEKFKTAGLVLVVLGSLGAGAAVVTGLGAEEQVEMQVKARKGGEAVLEAHEEIAIATAWVLGIVALGRIVLTFISARMMGVLMIGLIVLYLGLGSVGTGLLAITGYRGGQLVYEYGAGVQTHAVGAQVTPRHNDDDR